MKKILLTHKRYCLVDDEDFEWLNFWKWSVNSCNMVCRQISRNPPKTVLIHRLIMKPKNELQVDHINGDRLDNRRVNLRICTHSQNCINRVATTKNTSGYRGVMRSGKKWKTRIEKNGKKIYLGIFDNPEKAALAYNLAAIKLHGDFARLNQL